MSGIFGVITSLFGTGMSKRASRGTEARGEMNMLSHVMELRTHIVRALFWFLLFTIVAFCLMDPLISFLRHPYEVYQKAHGKPQELMAIGVLEVMVMNFQICMIVAGVLSLPFFIWEVWRFVSPALYEKEKRIAKPVAVSSVLLFYCGITFGFLVIVPFFLSNMLDWASAYANVVITVSNYFSSLTLMIFIFGLIFEVPVIFSLLGIAGLVHSQMLSKNRRIVFFICVILGAVFSPPDVFSQVIVTVPMYAMCELSIIALRFIEKKKSLNAAEQV